MAAGFSLKDHLFNEQTVSQLASEYAGALPDFDAGRFRAEALAGFEGRELMARLDWLADCVSAHLPGDFDAMAEALEAAMPPPLDPSRTDDDFGQFIHAVPGILAVRHGLERHRPRAMALLYQATQRFSMEFYIRPFLNRWPSETLAALSDWAEDENYHVRRLVSEGTRPKLPWAKAIQLTPEQTWPLLDKLHSDSTRYVTRSVANHLNDLSKTVPDVVVERLCGWSNAAKQSQRELDWMTRHALRSLVKSGHTGALRSLGYDPDVLVEACLVLKEAAVPIGGTLAFTCRVASPAVLPVLVDYRIRFARPNGRSREKVFKIKKGQVLPQKPFEASKIHKINKDATTFTWHPGRHHLILQVNGVDRAEVGFDVV